MPIKRLAVRASLLITGIGPTGCVPRAQPLIGAQAPRAAALPPLALAGRERVVFRWRYEEPGFTARGDGVARIAAPDSARLDFFLEGGFGSGWAALVGHELRTPNDDVSRRLVPPAPLLWAALGRLSISSARDTTLRISGDTLRADLTGTGAEVWRVMLVGRTLRGLEHILSGRVVERLSRTPTMVRYDDLANRRALNIEVQRREPASPFTETIWAR